MQLITCKDDVNWKAVLCQGFGLSFVRFIVELLLRSDVWWRIVVGLFCFGRYLSAVFVVCLYINIVLFPH